MQGADACRCDRGQKIKVGLNLSGLCAGGDACRCNRGQKIKVRIKTELGSLMKKGND